MSSYSFYNNPFPLFFSMSLQNNFTDFVINLRLRFNFTDLPLYNTSHLNISAFFTDQESINSFNNINSKFTIQKYVSVQKLILQDVAIIEDSDYTNYKQYSHLIIKLEENSKYNSNLPLQIEINPLISYSFNESKYLTKNIYNYGRLLNGYQVYSLSVSSEFLTIEFSANDIEIYNLCLFSSSGNSINETSIITNNETVKTKLSIRTASDDTEEVIMEREREKQKHIDMLNQKIQEEKNKITQSENYLRDLEIEYKRVKLVIIQFAIGLILIYLLQYFLLS